MRHLKQLVGFLSAFALVLSIQSPAAGKPKAPKAPKLTIEGTWVLTTQTQNGQTRTAAPGRDWLRIDRSGGGWSVSGPMTDQVGLSVRITNATDDGIAMVFAHTGGRNTNLDCRLSGDQRQLRCDEETTGIGHTTGEAVFNRRA